MKVETLETLRNGNSKHSSKQAREKKKQSIQLLMHCFTYNNYQHEHIRDLERALLDHQHIRRFCFQEEICPTTGTPHLQGSVWFKKKARWEELKLPFGNLMFWTKMRNEAASITYCTKERSAKEGGIRIIFGFPKPIVPPATWQIHLQWIRNHPTFIPREGLVVDNTKSGGGRSISHFDTMTSMYDLTPNTRDLASMFFNDDLRLHASMRDALVEYSVDII